MSLERLVGGPPVATLLKLLFLSLVIGAILAGFGVTPSSIPRRIMGAIEALADLGFGAVHDIGRYVLTGAIVVLPLWLLARLFGRGR